MSDSQRADVVGLLQAQHEIDGARKLQEALGLLANGQPPTGIYVLWCLLRLWWHCLRDARLVNVYDAVSGSLVSARPAGPVAIGGRKWLCASTLVVTYAFVVATRLRISGDLEQDKREAPAWLGGLFDVALQVEHACGGRSFVDVCALVERLWTAAEDAGRFAELWEKLKLVGDAEAAKRLLILSRQSWVSDGPQMLSTLRDIFSEWPSFQEDLTAEIAWEFARAFEQARQGDKASDAELSRPGGPSPQNRA